MEKRRGSVTLHKNKYKEASISDVTREASSVTKGFKKYGFFGILSRIKRK